MIHKSTQEPYPKILRKNNNRGIARFQIEPITTSHLDKGENKNKRWFKKVHLKCTIIVSRLELTKSGLRYIYIIHIEDS